MRCRTRDDGRNGLAMNARAAVLAASVCVAGVASAVEVKSASLGVTLDEASNGAVSRVVAADGFDFAAAGAREALFLLKMTRADAYTNSVEASSAEAKGCTVEKTADGVRLVYGEIGLAVEKVVCTVRAAHGDVRLRWRIAVTPKPGWMLEETHYPRMTVVPTLGTDPSRTAVVGGGTTGGVVRNPAGYAKGKTVFFARQPGSLAAQFVSLYDDSRLFFFGAEDGRGGTKALAVRRRKDGLLFSACRTGWDSDGKDFGYDFVVAALSGTAARPCSWHDAADLYKTWAVKQRWCRTPLKFRDDLPRWIREAPAMVRFYRQNFDRPEGIREWFHGYWLKTFPKIPLVAAMWGFEHGGTWVSDYFPCHPSDEAFKSIVADLRANGGHAFPWPSGYHWTLMYDKRPDGSFAYDSRERFNAVAAPHAVWKRDGQIYNRIPSWLKGGHAAAMCGGDPWARNWFNREVALEFAKRGCEAVQADQIVGGAFPECWATNHPHAPGQGPWKVEVFREQLKTMRETMREAVPDAVVCYEEPCEVYNDLIGLQDYRDCNVKGEWASVFNYLYHEYVPCFQSCIYSRDRRHWYAHMAVDGQIPLFAAPSGKDAAVTADAVAANDWYRRFMLNWVKTYHGEGRDWLAHGRQVRPPRITCAEVTVEEAIKGGGKVKVTRPAVHHAAYVSLDGRKALVFANATAKAQTVRYEWADGTSASRTIAPDEIVLVADDTAVNAPVLSKAVAASCEQLALNALAEADLAADAEWDGVRTREEFQARQRAVREKFVASLGGFPERTPLNARTTGTIPCDGYRIEKVVFESRPGFYATANAYVPDAAAFAAPYPALLVPVGHALAGKGYEGYQRLGVLGARAGFLSLVYDAIDQGERIEKPFARCGDGHNHSGPLAQRLGWGFGMIRAWDAIRAIDYLVSRTDVDGSRIAVSGSSGGGTVTSLVMAMDERVAAAAPSCFISSISDVFRERFPSDAEQEQFGGVAFGLNHLGYLMLTVPRPVLVCAMTNDMFPYKGTVSTLNRAFSVAERLGWRDRVGWVRATGPHAFPEGTKLALMDWFRHWLGRDGTPLFTSPDYRRVENVGFAYADGKYAFLQKPVDGLLTPERLLAAPGGSVTNLPGWRSTADLFREELVSLETARAGLKPSREEVAHLAGIRLSGRPACKAVGLGAFEADGMKGERMSFFTSDGAELPAVLLLPERVAGAPVLLVGDGSRGSRLDLARRHLAAGSPVLLPDLCGWGELAVFRRRFTAQAVPDEVLAMTWYPLGRNLVAIRAENILDLSAGLRERFGAAPRLVAVGRAAIPARHAQFVAPDAFAGPYEETDAPPSWSDEIRRGAKCNFADGVHGALRTYDWTELERKIK